MKAAGCLLSAVLALGGRPASAAFWGPIGDPLAKTKRLFDAGKYDDVIADLSPEALQRLKRDQARAYYYLAMSYERSQRLDKALGVYQLAVKLYPKDINLLTGQGSLLHRMGLEEQAEPLFQKVLQIHPNNAFSHLGLAEIDQRLGFLDRSAAHYEKALETMADQPRVWRDYAEVLLAQRDYRTAELAAKQALALSDEVESRVDLAFIARAQGRLEEALSILSAVLGEHPERTDIRLARALWLLEAGRYDEAGAGAQAALKDSPLEPLARWIDARVRLKKDQYNEAVKDLEAVKAEGRAAPFAAQAATALLSQLEGAR